MMSSIAKKSFQTLAVRITMQLFAAAGVIAIARTFLPVGKGEFTYAGTILGFALMATIGHNMAIIWQYSRRGLPPGAIIRVMVWLILIISTPVVIALVLIGSLIPSQHSLLFVAVALPFAVFSQSGAGILLGDGQVQRVNLASIFPTVGATLVYVPLIVFVYRSLYLALAVWAAGYVASGIYMMIALRRYNRSAPHVDLRALAKEQLTFGGQACLSSLGQYLAFRIDVFLVIYMLGNAALGLYSVGVGIGEFIWQLSYAMINPALQDIGGPDYARSTEVTAKCMRHSLILVFAAAVVVAAVARTVVPFIYGPAFSYSAIVTIALLPGIVSYSMMPALAAFFSQQLGEPRVPFYFSALAAVVCAVATALALPHFGIIAAAVATSISYTVAFIAAMTYFVRRTKMSARRIFALSADDFRPYYLLLTSAVGVFRGR